MGNMNDIYKSYGRLVNKEIFIKEIFSTLLTYNFADEKFLARIMKSQPAMVKSCLLDGIVNFCRDNPNMHIRDVCLELKVKSKYIVELIKEERLSVNNDSVIDLEIEFFELESEAARNNDMIQKNELAKQLLNTYTKSVGSVDKKSSNSGGGFHYVISKRR